MTTDGTPELQTDESVAPLPDEAVVVRGGLSTADTLAKTALAHFDAEQVFAISCRSRPGMTADELAAVEPPLPAARLRQTTVRALRAQGFDVIPDEPPPAHALVMLPRKPADDDYLKISALFGEPRPNPAFRTEAN